MTPGQKILGQIISVQPLALIVSLPNQLLGHVPITNISTQLTAALEAMDVDESDDEDAPAQTAVPDLDDIFRPGQYIRAVEIKYLNIVFRKADGICQYIQESTLTCAHSL